MHYGYRRCRLQQRPVRDYNFYKLEWQWRQDLTVGPEVRLLNLHFFNICRHHPTLKFKPHAIDDKRYVWEIDGVPLTWKYGEKQITTSNEKVSEVYLFTQRTPILRKPVYLSPSRNWEHSLAFTAAETCLFHLPGTGNTVAFTSAETCLFHILGPQYTLHCC